MNLYKLGIKIILTRKMERTETNLDDQYVTKCDEYSKFSKLLSNEIFTLWWYAALSDWDRVQTTPLEHKVLNLFKHWNTH